MSDKENFFAAPTEVEINGKKFSIKSLGFYAFQAFAIKFKDDPTGIAHLISQTVTGPEGRKFTFEEAMDLTPEYAVPISQEVMKLHGMSDEKNSQPPTSSGAN